MHALILAVSALLLFVSAWILVPAPNSYLLPLGVGAPELSPVLLAAACVLAALAAFKAKRLGTARLALTFALISISLCLVPLLQLAATVRQFDAAMQHTSVRHQGMRARLLTPGDLILSGNPETAVVATRTVFAAPADQPLTLKIYRTKQRGRQPILVQIYGGAWQRGTPDDDEWFARYFAARGYLVIAIDYRHAPSWKWPAQLEDIRSALAWIHAHAQEAGGDTTKIVLLGRSSGAQLAMAAGYEMPRGVRGVVSYYGPVDLADGWRHPPVPDPLNVRSVLETFLGGTPDQVPAAYRAASPITYASRRLPPTLLIYGARDHIVEARFGAKLDAALKKGGNTSVLLTIPWAEHAFDALPTGLGGQVALYYVERFLAWAVR